MADVLFKGGPCGGTHADADPAQLGTGTLLCGGINYHLYLLTSDNYLALLPGAHPPPEDAVARSVPAGVPDDATAAWGKFNRAFGRDVADAVNRTTRIRRAIVAVGKR